MHDYDCTQMMLFLLLCIPAALSSVSIFIFTFAAPPVEHLCVEPAQNTSPWADHSKQYSSCSLPQLIGHNTSAAPPCSHWVFDHSIFSSTAVEDFSMVCQDMWRASTAQVWLVPPFLIP